ncbi:MULTISPECIES: DUF885 domain-containing protein [unclassified Nocardioides]|uniref:DUF885 domain-containing protein n=1 Tax=unclassified Nocardioides TaxID=2615069 RepID=UPI0006F777C2|nr:MULTISPECIES: DUF885 domain-containing protein [unclassified Nocardioides]KRA31434.1 hypothetical protein ASD81_18545 [Nocardioides sp. Root614]KRA88054.1 hypothetical protein ASD84_18820 [Nocardioides sp. Root682]
MTRLVDARTDQFVEDVAALDPLTATYAGIPGHEHELPDYSPDGFAASEELYRRAFADVAAIEASDAREQVAKDAFLERVGLTVERADARVDRSELSVISSALHEVRGIFDLMPTGTDDEWDAIGQRLNAVPAALDGYRTTLLEEAKAGRVSARRQYVEVASQVRGWTGQEGAAGDYFQKAVSAAPDALKPALTRAAEAASASYAEFGRFIETDLQPRGRETDGVGREAYSLASRYFLGATVDLEETYAWGWEELKRIEDDMASTAQRIVTGGSVADAVAALDADPARDCGSREAFQEWMQTKSDAILADFDGVHFDIAEPIRTLACKVAPTNDGGAWYSPPTEDFSRPGTMWFSFTDDHKRYSTWRETTTVFHEGVPGHHLQCAQVVHQAELLNRWQRLLCWVSGHGEGWALYAERLMDELGYFADPGDRLGFLDMQGFRAARVIVDIGVHLGLTIPADNPFGWRPGEVWDADRVLEFMRAHSRMDDGSLKFEVNRYLGWPGQAPSYKVGERIWLDARADAQARHGSAFDLKAFHTAALDLGSLGLDPLKAALSRL